MSEQALPPKAVRRKKEQVRRFEPRTGVSQHMVDDEARYVAREVEDYCLLSLNDLEQKLIERRASWQMANDSLEQKVRVLDAREQAAVQCLLVRDCHHLFALYLSFVMSKIQSGEAPSRLATAVEEEAPRLPFGEWLFGGRTLTLDQRQFHYLIAPHVYRSFLYESKRKESSTEQVANALSEPATSIPLCPLARSPRWERFMHMVDTGGTIDLMLA
jgi:hypothetical protein